MLSVLCVVMCCGSDLVSASARPYRFLNGVRIGRSIRPVLSEIAEAYRQRTHERLIVTSGVRTPQQQAEAMLYKLERRQSLLRIYRNQTLAGELMRAYRRCRRRRPAQCGEALTQTIRLQVQRGEHISRHLVDSAVDIRSRSMTRRQQRIFREIVGRHSQVLLLQEGTPPHFHLQLRN